MKKINKAQVLAWFNANQDFKALPKQELEALQAIHEDKESHFLRLCFSQAPVSDAPDQIEEASFSKSFETFKDSLKGSKWANIINADNADFVKKSYRMLSATMVQGIYDFAHENGKALIEAQKAGIFDDLRFYKDHNFSVDSIVGLVGKSTFDSKSDVPGVNNDVYVSKTFDPKFADKFDKEIVDAVSVGINFTREKSHEFEDPWDFYSLLGREVEGEIVRFLVTEITNIRELSSVSEGADPYAKVLAKDDSEVETFSQDETVTPIEDITDFKALTADLQKALNDSKDVATGFENQVKEQSLKLIELESQLAKSAVLLALDDSFQGKLEMFAKKGQEAFTESRKKLVKFLRVTDRTAMAVSMDNEQDFSVIDKLHSIFEKEISSTFTMSCPSCNNEVDPTLQTSREDLAVESVVVTRNNAANDNVEKFCKDVHGTE